MIRELSESLEKVLTCFARGFFKITDTIVSFITPTLGIHKCTSLTRGDGPALAEFSEHDVIQLLVATKSDATVNQAKVSASSFEFGTSLQVLGS